MCRVSLQLREMLKQRLDAAVEEFFELLERTIKGYEEEAERQRRLLEQLLQPKGHLHGSEGPGESSHIEEGLHPEPPHFKEEQDIVITQFCNGLKTEEQLSAPSCDTNLSPSQTEPAVVCGFDPWAPSVTPTQNEEESPYSTKSEEEPLFSTQNEEESPYSTKSEEEPLFSTQNEEETPPFVCSLCSRVFRYRRLLELHLRVHSRERPFNCSVCGKTFSRRGNVKRHFLNVHASESSEGAFSPSFQSSEEKLLSCSVCERKFMQKSLLKRHLRIHSCMASVKQNTAARAPQEDRTGKQRALPHDKHSAESNSGQRPRNYRLCLRCGKFVNSSKFSRHLMIHTGEKPFRCLVCGKSFSRKDSLKAHMTLHSEQRPFTCSVCGVSKRSKREMRRHMSTHLHLPGVSKIPTGASGSKKKTCPICGKAVSTLGYHLKTHSGERPFICTVCGKSFSRKHHLQRHKFLHTRTSSGSFSSSDSHEKQDTKKLESSLIYCKIND